MKKFIAFTAVAVVVVAGARWHYSRGSALIALSPVEKQSLHDAPNEDPKAPKVDLRKLGLDPSNAAPVAVPTAVPMATVGDIKGNDAQAGKPSVPVEFVHITGQKDSVLRGKGKITMDFYISKTQVTVEQYAECVIQGKCKAPDTGVTEDSNGQLSLGLESRCNWGQKGRERHPINCVTLEDARNFAAFKGARLPRKWERNFAYTSKGKYWPYPWGTDEPTCKKANSYGYITPRCSDGTMPVCSTPEGNTEQGLCDMWGNVAERSDSTTDPYDDIEDRDYDNRRDDRIGFRLGFRPDGN